MILALALSALVGCVEGGVTPCHDEIVVGITLPSHNSIFAEGHLIDLEAQVNTLCGADVLDDAIYSLSSTVDGPMAGDGQYAEGIYSFSGTESLSKGSHELVLRVTGSGATGEGTISVEVVENTPPAVVLEQPGSEALIAEVDSAEIVAVVSDEHEALDRLVLSWSLDGVPIDGPAHAQSDGVASFVLQGAASGCHELEVSVTDVMDQSASDDGEIVLFEDETELDAYRWWVDIDGDGWGVEVGETISCEAPSGSVPFTTAEDCDDDDEDIHPGAADYCNDGIDSDCDPLTPKGCSPIGDVAAVYSDAYLGGGILDVAGAGDLNEDGHPDLAVGMSDRSTHLFLGPVQGEMSADYILESKLISGNLDVFRGFLGYSLDGGQDVNGDGVSDLMLGNPGWAYACQGNYTVSTGKAYLLVGGADLPNGGIENAVDDGAYLEGGEVLLLHTDYTDGCGYTKSTVGSAVALLSDMEGDGLADFAISSTLGSGEVWLVLSSELQDTVSGTFASNDLRLTLTGPDSDSGLGTAIASADVDGDGLGDLIVSAAPEDSAGSVYVIYARDLPSVPSSMDIRSIASLTFTGVSSDARAGADLAGVGDLDGDGDDEFLVAAPGELEGQGVVYLVPGFYEVNGSYGLEDTLASTSPNATKAVRLVGAEDDGLASVALAGDLNNDGSDDIVIGAPTHSSEAPGAGAAYLLYVGEGYWGDWWDGATGDPREDIILADEAAAENHTARIYSTEQNDRLGSHVGAAGDVSGDGIDDLVIGANSVGGTLRVFFGGGT